MAVSPIRTMFVGFPSCTLGWQEKSSWRMAVWRTRPLLSFDQELATRKMARARLRSGLKATIGPLRGGPPQTSGDQLCVRRHSCNLRSRIFWISGKALKSPRRPDQGRAGGRPVGTAPAPCEVAARVRHGNADARVESVRSAK